MYYLQTRWYDPAIGRFISPDSVDYLDPESFGGLNLYAYCLNSPIMYVDPTGHFPILTFCIFVVAGAVASGGVSAITQLIFKHSVDWGEVAIAAGFGALTSALSFIGLGGVWGQFAIQGALSVAEDLTVAAYNNELTFDDVALDELIASFLISGALGMIGADNAAREFKQITQIEKSMFKAIKSQVKKLYKGTATVGKEIFQQLGKKSGKKLFKNFINPTIFNLCTYEFAINLFVSCFFELVF